jgi:hypothetical protein
MVVLSIRFELTVNGTITARACPVDLSACVV